MTSILVAPLVVATFAAVSAAWLKRMPTWHFCPTCGHRTQGLVSPLWLKPVDRWLEVRWCPDCAFQATGRRGPDWIPGRRIAHDSGFHWGAAQMRENMGFEWREVAEEPPAEQPPDHPSGFRFGASAPSAGPRPAHRSGFTWGSGNAAAAPERRKADHPSGFSWGARSTDRNVAGRNPRAGGGFFKWKKPGSPRETAQDDAERRGGAA